LGQHMCAGPQPFVFPQVCCSLCHSAWPRPPPPPRNCLLACLAACARTATNHLPSIDASLPACPCRRLRSCAIPARLQRCARQSAWWAWPGATSHTADRWAAE
jgi:hypothetical protein